MEEKAKLVELSERASDLLVEIIDEVIKSDYIVWIIVGVSIFFLLILLIIILLKKKKNDD